MVRYKIDAERVAAVDAAVERLFAALQREQPAGIRFTYGRQADGQTYVALLELDDGADNPLLASPAARSFQEELRGHVAAPPLPEPLTVIGAYRSA